MTKLPDHIWFVRSNGGSGSYPVTRRGWNIVWGFVAGLVISALVGLGLSATAPTWVWVAVIALGMGSSAYWFITTARAHTDFSITYNEFMKDRKNA
jgi:hypothetical protein